MHNFLLKYNSISELWSPFGGSSIKLLQAQTLKSIAEKNNKTPSNSIKIFISFRNCCYSKTAKIRIFSILI